MRLLARYLLREFLVAFAYCFGAFLLLWIMFDLFFSQLRTIQDQKVPFLDILQYYILRIPDFLPQALPMALLLALLYALTTHTRHNEITAMRAAGISLGRLCLPYLSVGFLAAIVLFFSNQFWAAGTGEMAEQILSRRSAGAGGPGSPSPPKVPISESRSPIRKNLAFHNARENRFWKIGAYNLRTGEMTYPKVDWQLPDGSWRSLFADYAIRTNGVWTFYNVREVRQLIGTNTTQIQSKPDVLPVPEFSETPDEIKSEVLVSRLFYHPAHTRRADVPLLHIVNYLKLHPSPEAGIRRWLFTKLHGRFAGPVTCIVVVLLAVPFAVGSGRRNVFVGVAASIFIFFLYYTLQQVGFALGEDAAGKIPPWIAAWFPNLVFGIAGLWMMARVR